MPRQILTASDIRYLALKHKDSVLPLGSDDIITPEAMDVARELNISVIRETHLAQPAVNSYSGNSFNPNRPTFPLKMVFGKGVVLDPFGEGLATPGTNVRLKDVITAEDGSPMAGGYMELNQGIFPWTLTYDEIDIILDGELVITRDNVSVHGNPGDIIFIPKGSSITFGTPNFVRFFYVAFPVNWNEMT